MKVAKEVLAGIDVKENQEAFYTDPSTVGETARADTSDGTVPDGKTGANAGETPAAQ